MAYAAIVLILIIIGGFLFLQQPKFGKNPEGQRLDQLRRSPNFDGRQFRNLVQRASTEKKESFPAALIKYLVHEKNRPAPQNDVPSQKNDLKNLGANAVVWLGHSSILIRLNGKSILIDPVFSDQASPVSFGNKSFNGSNRFTTEDLPELDYLIISHDHWDHLDYPTVKNLKAKKIIVPLGVGAHFEQWGFLPENIVEGDWGNEFRFEDLTIYVLPAQHFSGRTLTRNRTLWAAYALTSPDYKIFFSGDSGYGPYFEKIGKDFGEFDLVMLDTGQYDPAWADVHMNPEEAAQAALDLKAKALLPAHIGKFSIAYHSWDDPFIRIDRASQDKSYRLLTPVIGQIITLDNQDQTFVKWWESVE